MTDHDLSVRASDADREAACGVLGAALADGRLDLAEYERRLDLAVSAGTTGELVALTADLPATPAQLAAERKRRELREWVDEWWAWLGGAVIMVGIWGVSSLVAGHAQHFWPVWPLGAWALVLLALAFVDGDRDRSKAAARR
ncbi:DUF1707 domain-containing protein [Solihabitans fulvus]|uniref:DUF1707 domain-containing protein n=1 Tax=Solihabitans fulvus TaxID=1892852 RepID=A0A5B2XHA4_9PSEU|nr:DUF1707 domain-containing protein [Solihabitans fulvus]KAA2262415.1 DUF1707 domain-containing protein [Solihabitans fulvus]